MSLVHARGLSLRYGPKIILDDANFALGPHDRIGLIGPNGTGKSTLLKILAGLQEPDSGTVQRVRGARVGYLAQEIAGLPSGSLLDGVLGSVPGRRSLEDRIVQTEAALAAATSDEDQLEMGGLLGELHEQLTHHDERFGRHRAEEILQGLGFTPAQLQKPATELSGGWRMRAALGSLLLQDPELLLLDEPTNHLDVPTLEWFDDFLRRSRRALMLVSHDREFLDRQIDRVLTFETEGLRSYTGNYEDYLRQRAAEEEQLVSRSEKQQKQRAQTLAFIERFRAKATKARQVQSRVRQLEKEEIIQVAEERSTVRFRFPPAPRSGREVARFENVSKRYGEKVVYRGLNGQILRGDRIAVIGLNGAGKTTLLKILAGEVEADAGLAQVGHGVQIGYFAQHHTERLNPAHTILEEVAGLVPTQPQSWVRSVLGSFLFSGDDVDKRIGVLSGGERARVALAQLLVVPSNFLLLDEPTNHLDLDSSEALIEALTGYEGTLLFVSHNRSFVNGLATQVWEVRDGALDVHPGDLEDWQRRRAASIAAEAATRASAAASAAAGPAEGSAGQGKESRRERAALREKRGVLLRPLQKEIAALEARIATLEAEKKQAEAQLADPAVFADAVRSKPLVKAYREAGEALDELYAKWEAKQAELEAASSQIEG